MCIQWSFEEVRKRAALDGGAAEQDEMEQRVLEDMKPTVPQEQKLDMPIDQLPEGKVLAVEEDEEWTTKI